MQVSALLPNEELEQTMVVYDEASAPSELEFWDVLDGQDRKTDEDDMDCDDMTKESGTSGSGMLPRKRPLSDDEQ